MINPKSFKKLDFSQVYTDSKKIDIPSESGWDKKRVKLKPQNYEGTIRVSAENAKPVERKFKIEFTDNLLDFKLL